jgi:hypothetical protein
VVTTFATDSKNDIFLGTDGRIVVLSGLQAVLSACEAASKSQLGEMVLTNKKGIPNFQAVWVGSPNYSIFQSYLRTTLLSVPDVIDVESIEISVEGDVLKYTATIETTFGTGVLNNG